MLLDTLINSFKQKAWHLMKTVVFSAEQVLRKRLYLRLSAQYTAENSLRRYKPKQRGNKEYKRNNLLSSSLLSKKLKIKIYRTIILPAVLYGCETWSLTLREERRLRVF